MGYYTEYKLVVDSEKKDSIIEDLRQRSPNAHYAIDEDGESQEACKWYDSHDDLIEFSKRYPDVVFRLSGIGEDFPDIWEEYFLDGKSYREEACITFPLFNKTFLT